MHDDFKENWEDGTLEEDVVCAYIMKSVATEDELIDMAKARISVADIMNGRYTYGMEHRVNSWRRSWNERLGFGLFTNMVGY